MTTTATQPSAGVIRAGHQTQPLRANEIRGLIGKFVAELQVDGRRIVVVVPDATRAVPIRQLAGLLDTALHSLGARRVDYLVALGTHQPMPRAALERHLGPVAHRAINHAWQQPDTLTHIGSIPSNTVAEISGGLLAEAVDVRVNRLIVDADLTIVCGPVFPHEVVGFSGGNKYFFPGVSDLQIINASHWLGALIGVRNIMGVPGLTPVRRLINHAAALIPTPRCCVAVVVDPRSGEVLGLYAGSPEPTWEQAAALSAEAHIQRVDRPYETVLSVMPTQYEDMWTAAKGIYKVEPVVADGGEVIIYAPHVTEFSTTHGEVLAQVGYHVRDYFLGQWDNFAGYPRAVLAHSTHVRGEGSWSAVDGEHPRIRVTLATGIDKDTCHRHGLAHLSPTAIDPSDWAERSRRDRSLLVVPKAGEILYRLAGD
jgi:nickel-dependent lactate racemase